MLDSYPVHQRQYQPQRKIGMSGIMCWHRTFAQLIGINYQFKHAIFIHDTWILIRKNLIQGDKMATLKVEEAPEVWVWGLTPIGRSEMGRGILQKEYWGVAGSCFFREVRRLTFKSSISIVSSSLNCLSLSSRDSL